MQLHCCNSFTYWTAKYREKVLYKILWGRSPNICTPKIFSWLGNNQLPPPYNHLNDQSALIQWIQRISMIGSCLLVFHWRLCEFFFYCEVQKVVKCLPIEKTAHRIWRVWNYDSTNFKTAFLCLIECSVKVNCTYTEVVCTAARNKYNLHPSSPFDIPVKTA